MNVLIGIERRTVEAGDAFLREPGPAGAVLLPLVDESPSLQAHFRTLLGVEPQLDAVGDSPVLTAKSGQLPGCSLFFLKMPVDSAGSIPVAELFQAAFREIAIAGHEHCAVDLDAFALVTDNFPQLTRAIWSAAVDLPGQAARLKRLVLHSTPRDLRGQYLRHFLTRQSKPAPSTAPAIDGKSPEGNVFSPQLASPALLAEGLHRLLTAYSAGESLDEALDFLTFPMRRALGDRALTAPAGVLKVAGRGLAQRLPWELMPFGDGLLGERLLLPRESGFAFFGRADRGGGFDVLGPASRAAHIASELSSLGSGLDPGCLRAVHCLAPEYLDEHLAAGGRPDLAILELAPDFDPVVDTAALERHASAWLAGGVRSLLLPLASFRSEEEAGVFRRALYTALLNGEAVGEALRKSQGAVRRRFGMHSGWFLYRLFGRVERTVFNGEQRSDHPLV